MRIKTKNKIVIWGLVLAMMLTMFGQNTLEAEAVTRSETNYIVNLKGSSVFMGNEIPGNSEIGTEYFMTYTVKKAPVASIDQQGLVASGDTTARYPYEDGGFIRWTTSEEQSLFVEGATYFIKCTIAEGGFTYEIIRMNGNASEAVVLDQYWGAEQLTKLKYIGVWIAGEVEAELTHVRCYNANGQDMGVMVTKKQGSVIKDAELPKNKKMEHYYDITVDNGACVALSNLRKPTTKKVYMEYTVESSTVNISQEGIILSNYPTAMYPFNNGVMRYDNYIDGSNSALLLEPGASYVICFEQDAGNLNAVIQKIKDGQRTFLSFTEYAQINIDEKASYFSLWFGDWSAYRASFHLTDFKCYDENNNNLAVQCNTSALIKHFGPLEDYARCEAAYYCKKNGNLFALYENKTLKFTQKGITEEGTYQIRDGVMTVEFKDSTQKLDYLYQQLTDEKGNEYLRLRNYTVSFETWGNVDIPQQELSNVTGYVVMKPEAPIVEGKTFEDWYTGDGKKFDFDSVVTESITLYAKYEGEDLPINQDVNVPVIPIVLGGVVCVGAVVLIVYLRKRGFKYGSNVEK